MQTEDQTLSLEDSELSFVLLRNVFVRIQGYVVVPFSRLTSRVKVGESATKKKRAELAARKTGHCILIFHVHPFVLQQQLPNYGKYLLSAYLAYVLTMWIGLSLAYSGAPNLPMTLRPNLRIIHHSEGEQRVNVMKKPPRPRTDMNAFFAVVSRAAVDVKRAVVLGVPQGTHGGWLDHADRWGTRGLCYRKILEPNVTYPR